MCARTHVSGGGGGSYCMSAPFTARRYAPGIPRPRPCALHRYAKRSSRACLGVTKLSVGRSATKPSSIAWKTGWA